MFGLPYSSPTWPAGADREYYRERPRRDYPNATEAQIDALAAAGAMIDKGSKWFRAIPHEGHGFAIVQVDDLPVVGDTARRAA